MSRDVSVHRFGRVYASVGDIPGDEQCLPLGTQAEVRSAISRFFPGTDWREPAWGRYSSADGSIEFNMGEAEPSNGFMLHIRASGEVVASILALCQEHGWQAIDVSRVAFLE